MEVGIRELKSHLSRYIAQARSGEPVVVTDRGKPVVRLEAVHLQSDHDKLPTKLQRLIESGKVIDKGPLRLDRLPKPLPPLRGDKTLSDLIIEERDESLRRYEWFNQDHPQ
ncbi:MAG TPA: type II toxin-antitoxin system prevent-host-death family antitoxin [Chloroflexota bacterium]|nr:type II toxin-antitoxin system prevent-host-death family antitoxin [Chloroflexota bacterium]